MSLARFNEIWSSPNYPPKPVSEEQLIGVEQRFGVRLPADYRESVLSVGLPSPTIALLDAIVERELDVHSLSDLYSPSEIIEDTVGWHEIGMPRQLIAFASDGCGNKFCFDTDDLNDGQADSCAIWFFDHDFGSVDKTAQSFEAWIGTFCNIEPWPAENDR